MQRFIVLPLVAALLLSLACGKTEQQEIITISGAWALYPMAQKWAAAYQAAHPGTRVDISGGGAGKGMTDALTGTVDIGMVSRAIKPEEAAQGAMAFPVVKDAVVATMHPANPEAARLRTTGVTRDQLAGLYAGSRGHWDAAGVHAVNLFTRADACGAAQVWAEFLGLRAQETLKGTGVSGDPGMAEAVGRDKLALGYNNIGFAYDPQTRRPYPTLQVVPLDLDNSGSITPDEDFYGTLDTLVAAINAGKYPSPPARDLYFVSNGKPTRPAVAGFLRWVMTDGQALVGSAGFVQLPEATVAAARARLE